jgi:hypothetical protein
MCQTRLNLCLSLGSFTMMKWSCKMIERPSDLQLRRRRPRPRPCNNEEFRLVLLRLQFSRQLLSI